MRHIWLLVPLALNPAPPADERDVNLEAPVQITADGQPIDVQRDGHSAPFMGDFDGDGLNDLLVGEFGDGRLRIYRNLGTKNQPRFEDYEWFKIGADLGTVPSG
jgi:hypothetical protein